MAPPDIDLIKMAYPAIARSDGDIFQLYVHVVLGYSIETETISIVSPDPALTRRHFESGIMEGGKPSINLPR